MPDQLTLPAGTHWMRDGTRAELADRAKRQISVTWATEGVMALARNAFGEPFWELLDFSAEAADLSRLNRAAPLLDSHAPEAFGRPTLARDRIGAVVRDTVRIEGDEPARQGTAVVQLSRGGPPDRQGVQEGILQDLEDGIAPPISFGYRVFRYAAELDANGDPAERDGIPILRAVQWQGREISFVPIPADVAAGVRSEDNATQRAEIANPQHLARWPALLTNPEGDSMPDPIEKDQAPKPSGDDTTPSEGARNDPTPTPSPAPETPAPSSAPETPTAAPDTARADEQPNPKQALAICRKLGLPMERAEELVDLPIGQVRARAIDLVAEHSVKPPGDSTAGPVVTRQSEGVDRFRQDAEASLVYQHTRQYHDGSEQRPPLVGIGLRDLANRYLRARGIEVPVDPMEFAGLVLNHGDRARAVLGGTPSHFPYIVANVANKVLLKAYDATPQPYRSIATRSMASDFRPMMRVRLGDVNVLEKVNPGGEIQTADLQDAGETYQLATYAKIFPFTRETLLNDDADAIGRIPRLGGAAAANVESDLAIELLTGNVLMGDGNQLFSAAHANQASGNPVLDPDGVNAIDTLIAKQFGQNGQQLGLIMRWLMVPPELKKTARGIVTPRLAPGTAADESPYQDLQLLVEPRLSAPGVTNGATAYFGFCGTDQIDVLQYAMLGGGDGPRVETETGFEIEGIKMKVAHDFGVAPMDWRGMATSNGSAS